MKRSFFCLLLSPTVASAGTAYDLTVRPLDQSTLASVAAPAVTDDLGRPVQSVAPYFVADGKVRIGAPTARTVYLFKDTLLYKIDAPAQSVDVLKHATLSEVAQHYADILRQLQSAAASAPPDQRAETERKVADMKLASERMRPPTPTYTVTVRTDTVDGHDCRIWEERENDVKRLEVCVAPTASIPGGADILAGMKTLGQFRQGANFALGVEFGLGSWWPDIARLGGVPLAVREYKYDIAISQTTLTGIHTGVPAGTLLDTPAGFRVQDAPAYMQWNVR